MIDARETIELYKNRLIELIDNGMIIGSYQIREESSDDQQDNSEVITFYINDIITKTKLTLTLRLGNHHPKMKNYVFHGNIPPHLTKNTSIEFYEPKHKEDGTLVRNRFDNRVRDKQGNVQPFSVTVFEYKPKLLEHDDVETIYNAILSYIENGNYTDPFANTPKRAWKKTKTSQIKVVQKSSSDEKTNESTRINKTRKIYKLNMTHIKRIDEMARTRKTQYFWSICEMRKSFGEWENYNTVEDSANMDGASDFYSPEDAYADGLENLRDYTDGDYSLSVYYFCNNGAGEYVSGYYAEIHNGKLTEY